MAEAQAAPPTVGSLVEGTVVGITTFGAFVQLEGGGTGLVHISEVANEYVRDIKDHLKLQDKVKVKILNVNPSNGKVDLSLKQASAQPVAPPFVPRSYRRWGRGKRELPEGADPVFEEKLSKFLKTSEERLLDIKRNIEAKRGGRYK